MASVPNRVYPLKEFTEISTVKLVTTDVNASGTLSGSRLAGLTARGLTTYSSSASPGEIYILTGAAGVTAQLVVKLGSGSTNAVWYGAALTYTSPT